LFFHESFEELRKVWNFAECHSDGG
jgi:hypothetical protein